MAAEADRKEMGEEEFERRREARRKRFGPVEDGPSRKDSGVASLGDEPGEKEGEEEGKDVMVVESTGEPKGVKVTFR